MKTENKKQKTLTTEKAGVSFNPLLSDVKTNGSVVDATFREIDEKFLMLSDLAKDWIKMKIMAHITEAYNRGKIDAKK